jgi:hypothetical protein
VSMASQDLRQVRGWCVLLPGSVARKAFRLMGSCCAAIVAYLIVRRGMHLEEAYALVASRSPSIAINPGFLRQLLLLEECIHEPSRRYQALGEYR